MGPDDFTKKITIFACQSCGENDWHPVEELYGTAAQIPFFKAGKDAGTADAGIPVKLLVCRNCNFVRIYADAYKPPN